MPTDNFYDSKFVMDDADDDLIDVAIALSNTEMLGSTLQEFAKPARLTPMYLLSDDVYNFDNTFTENLTMFYNKLYAGYYLSAVALIRPIEDVTVSHILKSLNSDGLEHIDQDALSPKPYNYYKYLLDDNKLELPTSFQSYEMDSKKADIYADTGGILQFDVTLCDNNKNKVIVPITLIPKLLTFKSDQFVTLNEIMFDDTSMKARWEKWRSGEINFWQYATAWDLVERHRKGLRVSEELKLLERRQKARSKTFQYSLRTILNTFIKIASNNTSVNRATDIIKNNLPINRISTSVTIDTETAKKLEYTLGGKLIDNKIRQKMFYDNMIMALGVVDTRMERLRLYQRGIDDYSVFSFKQISKASKSGGGGMEIDDVMKAMQLGNSVRF